MEHMNASVKCPNPACDFVPGPADGFCEACGTRLAHGEEAQVVDDALTNPVSSPAAVLYSTSSPSGAPDLGSASSQDCECAAYDDQGYCIECGKKQPVSPRSSIGSLGTDLACMSDVGRHHRTNQDAARVERFDNGDVLIVIADGVSSAHDAERASVTAVDTLWSLLQQSGRVRPAEQLVEAFHAADEAVKAIPYDASTSSLDYPQTTLVAAIVRARQAWIAWVGDSRAYVLGANSRVLTTDDSWYAADVAAGVPKAIAMRKENAHAITQCLGMRDDEMDVHTLEVSLEPHATLLLCSDGLWNYFEEPEVLTALMNGAHSGQLAGSGVGSQRLVGTEGAAKAKGTDSAREAEESSAGKIVAHFIEAANRAGGRDNISAGVLKVGA
jgi:serine/threonine protein phosphatase PrpC